MAESRRTILVRARFGLSLDRTHRRHRSAALRSRAGHDARRIARSLKPGQIALVTGPSGAGKSLILRALSRVTRSTCVEPIPPTTRKAPVDLIERPLDEALTLLSRLGLADAQRLVTPGGRLSEGERARLALAVAIDRSAPVGVLSRVSSGAPVPTILADEFASTLDTPTAESLAVAARRVLPPGARLVCATARDEIVAALRPDLLVVVPFEAPAEFHERQAGPCAHHPG